MDRSNNSYSAEDLSSLTSSPPVVEIELGDIAGFKPTGSSASALQRKLATEYVAKESRISWWTKGARFFTPLADTFHIRITVEGFRLAVNARRPLTVSFADVLFLKFYHQKAAGGHPGRLRFTFRESADLTPLADVQSVATTRQLYMNLVRPEQRLAMLDVLDDMRLLHGTEEGPRARRRGYVVTFRPEDAAGVQATSSSFLVEREASGKLVTAAEVFARHNAAGPSAGPNAANLDAGGDKSVTEQLEAFFLGVA